MSAHLGLLRHMYDAVACAHQTCSLPESGNMRRSGGGDRPLTLAAQPSLECSSEPVQAMKASAAALVTSIRPVREVPLKRAPI